MSIKSDTFFNEWLDIVLDAEKSDYHSDLEPFNVYKERMKAEGLKAFNDYIGSVDNGYHLILEKIKHNEIGG